MFLCTNSKVLFLRLEVNLLLDIIELSTFLKDSNFSTLLVDKSVIITDLWSLCVLFVFSIVYGCSNGTDVSSLCFEKEYYEKPLLENPSEIMFSGGSNNLSVEVSDDNVLEATINTALN